MTDLHTDLLALAADLDWPETPDLAAAVATRLPARAASSGAGAPALGGAPATEAARRASAPGAERARPRRRFAGRPRRVVLVLALLLLAVPAAAMAIPASRHAVLDALGLRHVTVERRTAPLHGATDPRLGRRVALPAGALTPTMLGAPQAVCRRDDIITLVYDRPRRVLLAQAHGSLPDRPILRKMIAMDDHAAITTVDKTPALFLAAPHAYSWSDATGQPVRSGPVLIWERGGTVLRLEGISDRTAARAIAASVR